MDRTGKVGLAGIEEVVEAGAVELEAGVTDAGTAAPAPAMASLPATSGRKSRL
jgi:hypothetical protein